MPLYAIFVRKGHKDVICHNMISFLKNYSVTLSISLIYTCIFIVQYTLTLICISTVF